MGWFTNYKQLYLDLKEKIEQEKESLKNLEQRAKKDIKLATESVLSMQNIYETTVQELERTLIKTTSEINVLKDTIDNQKVLMSFYKNYYEKNTQPKEQVEEEDPVTIGLSEKEKKEFEKKQNN